MKTELERSFLKFNVWLNRKAKSAAVRLTHWTGKSSVPMHPKHLIAAGEEHAWYMAYVQPQMRVLDVGSNNGAHTRRVAARAEFVVGMEYLWRDVVTAQRLDARDHVRNVGYVLDNVEQGLAAHDDTFDLVIFLDVIEHLHQRVEVLREIRRVLRPDGMLLISAPNRATSWKQRLARAGLFYYTDPDHKIEYDWPALVAELRAGGFVATSEAMPIVYDTSWAGLIDLVGGVSLPLYQRLQAWKVRKAKEMPAEAIGWRVVCRPLTSEANGRPEDSSV